MRIIEVLSQRSSDKEILLAHILKCQIIDLYKNPQKTVTKAQYGRFRKLLNRYKNGYPLAYLTGHKEFMSLDFKVTPAVLIPRPETELLVEQAVKSLLSLRCPDVSRDRSNLVILDIGTGSGNIAIAIAKHCRIKNLRIIASDISKKALNVARLNARRYHVSKHIRFCCGDLFAPLKGLKVDFIVSNPPYVDRGEKSIWQPGLKYEPARALWAGKKGMLYIEKIIRQAPEHLKQNGYLLMEIGINQAKATHRIAKQDGCFRDIKIINDYNHIPRVFVASRC